MVCIGPHKPGMVVHPWNPSIWEVQKVGAAQGHPSVFMLQDRDQPGICGTSAVTRNRTKTNKQNTTTTAKIKNKNKQTNKSSESSLAENLTEKSLKTSQKTASTCTEVSHHLLPSQKKPAFPWTTKSQSPSWAFSSHSILSKLKPPHPHPQCQLSPTRDDSQPGPLFWAPDPEIRLLVRRLLLDRSNSVSKNIHKTYLLLVYHCSPLWGSIFCHLPFTMSHAMWPQGPSVSPSIQSPVHMCSGHCGLVLQPPSCLHMTVNATFWSWFKDCILDTLIW